MVFAHIRIPITEVLLCTAVVNPSISKKQRYWLALNAVLLLPLLTESAVWDGKMAAANLLKVFAKRSTNKGKEE